MPSMTTEYVSIVEIRKFIRPFFFLSPLAGGIMTTTFMSLSTSVSLLTVPFFYLIFTPIGASLGGGLLACRRAVEHSPSFDCRGSGLCLCNNLSTNNPSPDVAVDHKRLSFDGGGVRKQSRGLCLWNPLPRDEAKVVFDGAMEVPIAVGSAKGGFPWAFGIAIKATPRLPGFWPSNLLQSG